MTLWSIPNQLGASRRSASSFGTDSKIWAQNEPKEMCLWRVSRSVLRIPGAWAGNRDRLEESRSGKDNEAAYYKEGVIEAHRQNQFCQTIYLQCVMGLVKIKSDDEFHWGAEQQQAFDEIKEYLSKPPVLVPPQQDRPFYVYLSMGDTSIASVLIQKHDDQERVVF